MPARASAASTSGCSSAGACASVAALGPSRASRTSRPSARPRPAARSRARSFARSFATGLCDSRGDERHRRGALGASPQLPPFALLGGAIAAARDRWARPRGRREAVAPGREGGARPRRSISVCLPARECAATVGRDRRRARAAARGGRDRRDRRDRRRLSRRHRRARAPRRAPASTRRPSCWRSSARWLGKGDAMWRALIVLEGELVCFLDADSEDFAAALLHRPARAAGVRAGSALVKAFYRRPFAQGGISLPEGGGRVNHLIARPALALFYPELAAVRQPLAGEIAARRALLERLPFATGYGVEIAMLLDVSKRSAWMGWRRSISTSTTTATSPCPSSDADGLHRARHDRTPARARRAALPEMRSRPIQTRPSSARRSRALSARSEGRDVSEVAR